MVLLVIFWILIIFRFTDRGEDSGDTETIFTTPDGKFNSGYHFKNPSLSIQYDLVNYNKTQKKVYLDLELEYLDGLVGVDAGHVMKSVAGTTPRAFVFSIVVQHSYL